VSVITSIGIDHVKQFGNTLEGVALEKSAIIKPGVPVVIYGHNSILEQVAREKNAPCIVLTQEKHTNLL
jgi:dihydrofolate synthase / folylpolyglutamate synthase